jgi:hypothetical protein
MSWLLREKNPLDNNNLGGGMIPKYRMRGGESNAEENSGKL